LVGIAKNYAKRTRKKKKTKKQKNQRKNTRKKTGKKTENQQVMSDRANSDLDWAEGRGKNGQLFGC
jgi:hypothetical protein